MLGAILSTINEKILLLIFFTALFSSVDTLSSSIYIYPEELIFPPVSKALYLLSVPLSEDSFPPLIEILDRLNVFAFILRFHKKFIGLVLSVLDKIESDSVEDITTSRSFVSTLNVISLLILLVFPYVLINFPELIATVAFPI